jgi:lycopene cyclase domain-containing protein
MTYLVLSVVFIAIAAVTLAIALWTAPDSAQLVRRWWRPIVIAGVAILVLTAVFDNVMIGSGLMRYGEGNIIGVRLGVVPVEDFAYPIAGLLLLPALWILFRGRDAK